MLIAKPISYGNLNDFTDLERLEIIQGNAQTCYVQLRTIQTKFLTVEQNVRVVEAQTRTVDVQVRYIPQAGSSIQISFPRTLSVAAVPVSQDVIVMLIPVDSRDASLYRFDISSAQSNLIVSGGVKLLLTEGGVQKVYPIDNFVIRRSNAPGA
jgi:hypothetical protein